MEILTKAYDTLRGIVTKKVKTYDPKKNKILIANSVFLDGVVSAQVDEVSISSHEGGVDPQYYAIIESHASRTLVITLIPTANCYQILLDLAEFQKAEKTGFSVNIVENGGILESYTGHIMSFGDRVMSAEGEDKVVVFGITPKHRLEYQIQSEEVEVGRTNLGAPITRVPLTGTIE